MQPVAVLCYTDDKANAESLDTKAKEKFSIMSKSFRRRAVFFALNYKFDETDLCKNHGDVFYFADGAGTSASDGGNIDAIEGPKDFFDQVKEKLFTGWYDEPKKD